MLAGAAALIWVPPTRSLHGQSVVWHIGPGDGRTDPFVAWVREMMRSRYGVVVRTQVEPFGADLLTLCQPLERWHEPWRMMPASFAVVRSGTARRQTADLLAQFLLSARSQRTELGFM